MQRGEKKRIIYMIASTIFVHNRGSKKMRKLRRHQDKKYSNAKSIKASVQGTECLLSTIKVQEMK